METPAEHRRGSSSIMGDTGKILETEFEEEEYDIDKEDLDINNAQTEMKNVEESIISVQDLSRQ